MSKYDPLKHFLETRPSDREPMTFAEVERVLRFSLPNSARAHPQWWSNNTGSHVGVHAWRDAGWRTARVDIAGERVVFVKESGDDDAGQRRIDSVTVRLADLGPAARRLLQDYTAQADGDRSAGLARAVHEAALARRGRLIDEAIANAPRVSDDSVDLIREDRDAR